MQVTLANPTGLDATAAVSFSAALDGQAPQPFTVDWGDGSAPQKLASGAVGAGHTYAKAGSYKITVASNNVTSTQVLTVGNPFPAPGAKVRRTQEVIRQDTAALLGTTSKLG